MKRIENECVGCPYEMGCLDSACPYINVERFYCDKCGEETDLYEFDDQELCIECIAERLKPVN